ncbi:MAG: efflux RND transporter periplasmic adaptor subunit [Chitinophagales bacterium]
MIEKTKKLNRKKLLFTGLIVILALLIVFKIATSKREQPVQAPNITSVQVKQVQMTNSRSVLYFKANLEPVQEAIVSSKLPGLVVDVNFEDGDMVSAGQVLVSLDDQNFQNQLRAAQINLKKLQTTQQSVQKNYERKKALYESGALSTLELENAEDSLKMAVSNLETEQVNIASIENSISNSVLRAPIGGEIAEKNVILGQYLNPGTIAARIKNNRTIKATINIKESDLKKVKTGQKVILKLSKDDKDGYEGIVKTVASSANNTSRVFKCLVEVDNFEGKLHSGIFGYIVIPDQDQGKVLSVPLSALSGTEGNYSIFVLENNTARQRSIDIGNIQNDQVEVRSGISAGETVIITNINTLQDGDPVQISGQGV